jgi:hypothetical protein
MKVETILKILGYEASRGIGISHTRREIIVVGGYADVEDVSKKFQDYRVREVSEEELIDIYRSEHSRKLNQISEIRKERATPPKDARLAEFYELREGINKLVNYVLAEDEDIKTLLKLENFVKNMLLELRKGRASERAIRNDMSNVRQALKRYRELYEID